MQDRYQSVKTTALCTGLLCLIGSSAQALESHGVVRWEQSYGGNGHLYEAFSIEDAQYIQYEDARLDAIARGGHLVTITSQAEDDFIRWQVADQDALWSEKAWGYQNSGPWIGGYADSAARLHWVNGEPWSYTNWHPGNPNNGPDTGVFLFDRDGNDGGYGWNDANLNIECCVVSYIVEYDADCNGDGIIDYEQIFDGTLPDTNGNGVPDECEDDLWVWGRNAEGECDVPEDLLPIVEVEGTGYHVIVLQVDGSIRCWGKNSDGQCDPPIIDLPWVDVAGGDQHSIGLDSDGRIHCWGDNSHGQCDVPSDLPAAIAVGTGSNHSLAVLVDGSVAAWGYNPFGALDVPAGLLGVVEVTGGAHHSAALRTDGTIVAWGGNDRESEVPAGHAAFVDLKVSQYNSIALTSDGVVVVWGRNWFGQANVPNDLAEASLIGIGAHFAMVKTTDNEMACWGSTSNNECALPSDLLKADNLGACSLHGTAWIASPLQIDDCNDDGIVDYRQILSGELADENGNGIPDCCEQGTQCGCPGDLNQNEKIDGGDISILIGWWGLDGSITPSPDLDGNGVVDGADLTILLGAWGPCS